ncbi:MAG: Cytosol aminopeptidase PepA [uncultured Chloroflexi bacterium]|uniref:Probable cytosol aminopeptidase n=1 Tax=uncultured Chloroflexota bacterium TaxID=166587 RepID=A0A6J4HWD9_9CHLR|nr:MAG: Cytosol aminopeptidase PepA [uncultured Chloroflexota bacterium]
MNIRTQVGQLGDVQAGAVAVNLFQGVTEPGGATGMIDRALGGAITRLIATGDFTGKINQVAVLYPAPGAGDNQAPIAASRVILVGLGKQDDFTLDRVRQVSATAARRARDLGAKQLATIVHGAGAGSITPQHAAQALVEGAILGLYRFEELKSRPGGSVASSGSAAGSAGSQTSTDASGSSDDDDRRKQLEELIVFELDGQKASEIETGVERGRILAESQVFARTLVDRPGNILPPEALAGEASRVAAEVGLGCEILTPDQMAELGMGSLLGVAQGSEQPARFIILEHAPEGMADQPPVVLCGKGITFDTGGISLKPPEGMGEMKNDMGGGAAVIGALRALALLKVQRRVIGLVPAVENMPSGKAFRPGDVLRAMDGQTIEVISTDAEGRLVLADALAYAQRYKPIAMLDVATLTGGVVTALGHGAAGVMANDPDVVERLKLAASTTGEKVWELPLWDDEYKRLLRSDVADMKNSGGRAASAIGGGMFLKQFAKKVPWAHLDIAGMARAESDSPYKPKGSTGYGVRLLAEFAASYA